MEKIINKKTLVEDVSYSFKNHESIDIYGSAYLVFTNKRPSQSSQSISLMHYIILTFLQESITCLF
nr:MAG TPA: hypothetical protein [Caudoviricetes sp.]